MQRRRARLLLALLLAFLGLACVWAAWSAYGVQGAHFTHDLSRLSRDEDVGFPAETVLWLLAAAGLLLAAMVLARGARR